jgi:hypothetical protein
LLPLLAPAASCKCSLANAAVDRRPWPCMQRPCASFSVPYITCLHSAVGALIRL